MARDRITISLDRSQAERIRRHAERAGMDVSAYLVHAATRQMAETEAIEEQFAGVDGLIAAAEREAAVLPPEPDVAAGEVTEQERREIEAALALVRGEDRARGGTGEAA
ncbi:ribbon-helix-helix protein, CopG family [Streptomyces sp. JJ36]|uniref:ribbon-helix-helix protein, CopG family n=1 Tax=Streptomyces sp. JJ36 TaxID=2736645 RepID=UPI001F026202|nr:ribbon-helix-helix protein, CopG family [Streptomyces sp. JJ36]